VGKARHTVLRKHIKTANMMSRLTAHQALQRLQDIKSDCSNGELCDSEDPLGNNAPPSAV